MPSGGSVYNENASPLILRMTAHPPKSVVLANAGSHRSAARGSEKWIPAFAGVTIFFLAVLGFCGTGLAAERVSDRQMLHILNRLAFGPTIRDIEHIKAVGIDRYIAEQLTPESIPEPTELTERLAALDTLKLDPVQLFTEYGPLRPQDGVKPSRDEQKARRQRARIILEQAQEARIWRALYSPRQLQEVMADFWFNHFNVFAGKGLDHLWVGAYEEQAIRPYALGKFRDLLGAVAHHPAMLFYLDNVQNAAPGSNGPNGREAGLNENYARELMELHTLGIDGGYTQDDVVALARILTGWSLMRPNAMPEKGLGFAFYPGRHDQGGKRFLGQDIAANGEAEGDQALDMLAKSPATARHIASRLAQYFVADKPPQALVDRLAARFSETDGDIREVLKALFASREFGDDSGGKYKTPYRFALSATRAAGVTVNNPRPLLGAMARLGQSLYGCQTPDGYPDSEDAWLSPDGSMLRVNFATALAGGKLPLADKPAAGEANPVVKASATTEPSIDPAVLEKLLGPMLTSSTRATIAAAPTGFRAALILGSPDFMRR
jgi:uncharacterized protein (DUF1800 family)